MNDRRAKRTKTAVFWQVVGGRKQFNGYLYAILVTVMVFALKGTFAEYGMWLAAALLGTSLMVAHEDSKGERTFPTRRTEDVPIEPPAEK